MVELSASDVSINKLDVNEMSGVDVSIGNLHVFEMSGTDVSINNLEVVELSASDVSINKLEVVELSASDVSINKLDVNELSCIDVSINILDCISASVTTLNLSGGYNLDNRINDISKNLESVLPYNVGFQYVNYGSVILTDTIYARHIRITDNPREESDPTNTITNDFVDEYLLNKNLSINSLIVTRDISVEYINTVGISADELSCIDASVNILHVLEMSGIDVSINNLEVVELSASDVSINRLDVNEMSGVDVSISNLHVFEMSGSDVSINKLDVVELSCNDASINKLDVSNISTDIINFQDLEFKKMDKVHMSLFTYDNNDGSFCQLNLLNRNYGYAQQITPGTSSILKWRYGDNTDLKTSDGSALLASLESNGSFKAQSIGTFSDDRIKHNEQNIKGLETIRVLKPQKYIKTKEPVRDDIGNMLEDYINKDISGTEEAGFIAQDILRSDISFCVSQITGEVFNAYTVDYNSIFTYAVQAIKELDTIVKEQSERINKLEAKNDMLRGLIQ